MLYRDEIYHSLCCYVIDMQTGQRGNSADLIAFFDSHDETPLSIEFDAMEPLITLVSRNKETGETWTHTLTLVLAVLRHPDCPSRLLEIACRSGNERYRTTAVQNPNCPVEHQVEAWLAREPDFGDGILR